jgi:hypothetical protein
METACYFPILQARELVTVVGDWGISISEEDLLKPSANTVQSIYCTLLAEAMGIEMRYLETHRDVVIEDVEFRVRCLGYILLSGWLNEPLCLRRNTTSTHCPSRSSITTCKFSRVRTKRMAAKTLTCMYDRSARLCKTAQIDSYTLQDLTRPEPGRTRKILSGLHNFMLFRQQMAPTTEKHLKRFDEAVERESQLDYELEEKKQRIKELK